jgi:hypothetical protein
MGIHEVKWDQWIHRSDVDYLPVEVGAGAVVNVVPIPLHAQKGVAVVTAVLLELFHRLEEDMRQKALGQTIHLTDTPWEI